MPEIKDETIKIATQPEQNEGTATHRRNITHKERVKKVLRMIQTTVEAIRLLEANKSDILQHIPKGSRKPEAVIRRAQSIQKELPKFKEELEKQLQAGATINTTEIAPTEPTTPVAATIFNIRRAISATYNNLDSISDVLTIITSDQSASIVSHNILSDSAKQLLTQFQPLEDAVKQFEAIAVESEKEEAKEKKLRPKRKQADKEKKAAEKEAQKQQGKTPEQIQAEKIALDAKIKKLAAQKLTPGTELTMKREIPGYEGLGGTKVKILDHNDPKIKAALIKHDREEMLKVPDGSALVQVDHASQLKLAIIEYTALLGFNKEGKVPVHRYSSSRRAADEKDEDNNDDSNEQEGCNE